MDLDKLIKRWEQILEAEKLPKIKNPKIMKATALMLENEARYLSGNLNESSHTEYTLDRSGDYSTNGDFHQIAIPMVRRTFPELIAHEIVGVQPMTGPVGLAFAIRYRAGQSYDGSIGTELGYNTIDKDYSLTTPVSAAEALGSKAGSGVGNDIGLGIGAGNQIKEINMTVEKDKVEAKTRKLRSRWALEVAQDLKAMHGLDIEEEMMDALSYEITAEIDREIIAAVKTAATTSTATSGSWNYTTADGRWENEVYRTLYNKIIRLSNQIAITSRRCAGNFIIAFPNVCAALETLSNFMLAPVPSDINTGSTGIARIGSMDGRLTLYRDTFATSDELIVGYKGPSQYDTGIVYLPYIQLMQSRATFENSFNPAIGLMSRYAIHSHMLGAQNYYQYLKVENLP